MNKNYILYLKVFGIWVILAIAAILVATFRNTAVLPTFGEQTAHQIGTLIFLVVQFFIIYLFIRLNKLNEVKTAFYIGICWVILTIIFEFLFGHFVMGHSWEKLLADYNLFKGRLWLLVLINNVVAPVLSSKFLKE